MIIYPIFSKIQELKLFRRYHAGDGKALEQLLMSFQPFLFKIAIKYCPVSDQKWDDLIQAGNLETLKMMRVFNPNKNTRFVTYAWFRIQRGIWIEYNNLINRVSGLPFNKMEEKKTGISYCSYEMIKNIKKAYIDTDIGSKEIRELINTLSPALAKILIARGDGYSYVEIARNLKIDATTVRNKYLKGLSLLKARIK